MKKKTILFTSAAMALYIFSPLMMDAAAINVKQANIATCQSGTEGAPEYNYDNWHVASIKCADDANAETLGAEHFSIVDGVLKLHQSNIVEPSRAQVIKGFAIADRPVAITDGIASWDYTNARFQIPVFYGDDHENFTTLRPNDESTTTVSLADTWRTSQVIVDADGGELFAANATATLSALIDALGAGYSALGFGVSAYTPQDAEVRSLTWGGDTYTFGYSAGMTVTPTTTTAVEVDASTNFELRVTATGRDVAYATTLEVDHSMEGVPGIPEFNLYVGNDAETVWGGSAQLAQATAAGVTASYANNQWVINFGADITATFLENGGITFYLALKDEDGEYVFGNMSPTSAENTFAYQVVEKQTPPPSSGGSSGGGKSGGRSSTAPVVPQAPSWQTELAKLTTISQIQSFLNEKGYGPLAVDGLLGAKTLTAIELYKQSFGETSTTPAQATEPSTAVKLNTTTLLKVGARGAEVQTLQMILNAKGYGPLATDGIFGVGTRAAVIKFQAANSLVADGIVGLATTGALNK